MMIIVTRIRFLRSLITKRETNLKSLLHKRRLERVRRLIFRIWLIALKLLRLKILMCLLGMTKQSNLLLKIFMIMKFSQSQLEQLFCHGLISPGTSCRLILLWLHPQNKFVKTILISWLT
jgi:hypothetical protein